jgi:glycosyltransferase involved in cell wall biosynthesis
MHPFWQSITQPLFEILKPREIVEIGADYGDNTRNLLEWCRLSGARAHVIDPFPKFDPENFKAEYGDVFVFYKGMSLSALPMIGRMDAMLIDGDHNWYTVYHELKLIEKSNNHVFPLVFIHDVAWPYARRDMYYDPETIPEAWRMAYARKGLDPDSIDLVEEGGLNPHLCNARYAHNIRNGVLTAVEDFMRESTLELELVTIDIFYGLGILFPSDMRVLYPEFDRFIRELVLPETSRELVNRLEIARIRQTITIEESKRKIRDIESTRRRENEAHEQVCRNLEQTLDAREKALETLEARVRADTDRYKAQIEEERLKLLDLDQKRRKENAAADKELQERKRKINHLEQQVQSLEQKVRTMGQSEQRLKKEKDQLSRWMAQIQEQFNALINTNRWIVGNALVGLATLSALRKNRTTAADHIRRILNQYEFFKTYEQTMMPDFRPAGDARLPVSKTSYPRRRYNLTVAVIAWDVGHNPLGRAYLLAEALSRYFHVILLGPQFKRYNTRVWAPLADARIPVLPLPGDDFPGFLRTLEKAAPRIEADIVISCKPRLPSVQMGLMMKAFLNRPVFIDIDDYELSFFKQRSRLSLEDIRKQAYPDLKLPFEETWTRFAEGLITHADGWFVSNPALAEKFGGIMAPHARDEARFDPSLYDRQARRRELGIDPDDKVVLFLGTPRPHKGVTEVLEALRTCNNPRYKLCVTGTPPDRAYDQALRSRGGDSLIMLPDQPFDRLAENLIIADLICLIQDPESEISRYQLPAKVIDALAMGIPVLATETGPLASLVRAGVVTPVTPDSLAPSIDRMLSEADAHRRKQLEKRDLFLKQYSYAAITDAMRDPLLSALEKPRPLDDDALAFLEVQRSLPETETAPGQQPSIKNGAIDIVVFWKQNDTGLYGRRSDMFIKYLALREEIGRIAIFDMPISIEALREKAAGNGISHDRMIYRETLLRNWGVRDTDKISFHTFIYGTSGADRDKQIWQYPDESGFEAFVARRLETCGIDPKASVFWFYPYNPHIPRLARSFKPRVKVVDLVDDHRTWPDLSEIKRLQLTLHYREVLKSADLALANCETVRAALEKYHPDIRLVPNGCEIASPPEAPSDEAFGRFAALGGPKLVYVGNLEKGKIDTALIQTMAEKRPDWQICLIGSTHANPEIMELDVFPNIHFFGVVGYPEVRAWINACDVAILPHVDSAKTQSMNPLKLYVYCSLGVPVVATDIRNMDDLRSHVAVASSDDDFIAKVEDALSKGKKGISGDLRQCLAANSWEQRVETVMTHLKEIK